MSDEITVSLVQNEVVVSLSPQNTVEIASSGPQGPPGPTGPAGGEQFEETWTSPVSSVVVNHNLNRYPAVVVILDGAPVGADVTYNSLNQITVTFSGPQGPGRVECI